MGQCVSSPQLSRKSPITPPPKIEKDLPLPTQKTLISKEVERRCFQAIISNFILTKYPYKKATPVVRLGERNLFELQPEVTSGGHILKWQCKQKLKFQMAQSQLKANNVEVDIINQESTKVSMVKFNLYQIAIGPSNQDFLISYSNGCNGRISFDLKLSQLVQIKIKTLAAKVQFSDINTEGQFKYSIKAFDCYHGQTCESEHSHLLFSSNHQQYLGSDKVMHRTHQKGKLPIIGTKLLSSEMHNTYLKICVWKVEQSKKKQSQKLYAQVYVSFLRLFETEANRVKEGGKQYECRNIRIQQKIEHYGKQKGKGIFQFSIVSESFFKQHQICVNTENGIVPTTRVLSSQRFNTQQICSQMQQLLTISEKIKQNVTKYKANSPLAAQSRKNKLQIEFGLERIFNLLQKSSHLPLLLYEYGSQNQLLRGQKILVSLGTNIIDYLSLQDPIIHDVCWLILISIIKRTQLSLSYMAFNSKQIHQLKNNNANEHLQQKQKMVTYYRNFSYKLLGLALRSLNNKGSQYQTIFGETYCAYAYFQIPQFRRELLKVIVNESDPEIVEWRGIDFNLRDDIEQCWIGKNSNIFTQLLEWESSLYDWAEVSSKENDLNDILSHHQWRQKFKSRGLTFLHFIQYWLAFVKKNLPNHKDIQWRSFPGYNRLLKAIFSQMKAIPLLQYPQALLETCIQLMAYEKLVNPIIKIILSKVNSYDSSQVVKALSYINRIFQWFTKNKKSLPVSFNYSYLYQCLKIILLGDSSIAISAVLKLLYNHFSLFHIEFKKSISMSLLGKIFWKLFLHWSFIVRKIFYHLIIFKVYAQSLNAKQQTNNKFSISYKDILERYKHIVSLMSNKQQQYNRVKQNETSVPCDQYYKKMKLKSYSKFRKDMTNKSSFDYTKDSNSQQTNMLQLTPVKICKKPTSLTLFQNNTTLENLNWQSLNSISIKKALSQQKEGHQMGSRWVLFEKIIDQQQYEVEQLMSSEVRLIIIYSPQFKKIERYLQYSMEKQSWKCLPLHYEISLDKQQGIPKEIDTW